MTDMPTPGAALAAPANPRRKLTWPETRDVLAVLSTLLFAGGYLLPWFREVPVASAQNIGQLQGALIMQWALVMGWYFGSSKNSAAKDAVISALSQPDATKP